MEKKIGKITSMTTFLVISHNKTYALEYHTLKNASPLKDKLALYLTLLFSAIRRTGKTYKQER